MKLVLPDSPCMGPHCSLCSLHCICNGTFQTSFLPPLALESLNLLGIRDKHCLVSKIGPPHTLCKGNILLLLCCHMVRSVLRPDTSHNYPDQAHRHQKCIRSRSRRRFPGVTSYRWDTVRMLQSLACVNLQYVSYISRLVQQASGENTAESQTFCSFVLALGALCAFLAIFPSPTYIASTI